MYEIYRDYEKLTMRHIEAWWKSYNNGYKKSYEEINPCWIEAKEVFENYYEGASYWLQKKLSKQSTKP